MNLVVVQDYLRSGGTERQSVLLADAFAEHGHTSTLLTFRPGGTLAPTLNHARHLALQGFDTRLDWWAPRLQRTLVSLRPDAVLCMGRMANSRGVSIKRTLTRACVIATMRTGKSLPWMYRRSLLAADHVIANSRDAVDTLVDTYGVDRAKCSAIANSLVFRETRDAAAQRAQLRRKCEAEEPTVVLLCVAMFRPEKNQRELIEIASELPRTMDWQLWFVGDGPELASCEQAVDELGLGRRVKFLGWMKDPTPAYAAADVAVHASRSEALSNFLIEAQAHGLPVVAYQAQGNRECVVPGHTGHIVAPGNADAFRSAILEFASADPAARAGRAAQARRFARDSFDPDKQIRAYLALIERLAVR